METQQAFARATNEAALQNAGGLSQDDMMQQLQALFARYEVPASLLGKLLIMSEFDVAEWIIDDSGSMGCSTDSKDPRTGRPYTRWEEAKVKLQQCFEVISVIPAPREMYVRFMTRRAVLDVAKKNETPRQYHARVCAMLDAEWKNRPCELTPAREAMEASLNRYRGKRVLRTLAGDGCPNGGKADERRITEMVKNRANPQDNIITFWSCTNDDDAVSWMKDADDVSSFTGESDDFADESDEVRNEQGNSLNFSFGLYLICALVGACFPDSLDSLDESAPLTRGVLEELCGYSLTPQDYAYYFRSFLEAQRRQNYQSRGVDGVKREFLNKWPAHEAEFWNATRASDIPVMNEFRQKLKYAESAERSREPYGGSGSNDDCCCVVQ